MSIMILSDNVLLDIFDLYRNNRDDPFRAVWEWHILAHVCRRWRQIIFDSPLRLDLQIPCTSGAHVKKCGLDIWPNLPIYVDFCSPWVGLEPAVDENIVAALAHPDRVAHLGLVLTDEHVRTLAPVIQKPFPMLKHLILFSGGRSTALLPAEFMGGSAPRLQKIDLLDIAFPALPTLLRSASDLVELKLKDIPRTGYISPEMMVACLVELPRLKTLFIGFQYVSSTPHSDRILPPSITRITLPALTRLHFLGIIKYLEDLTARIVCPRLDTVDIQYVDPSVDLRVVQLSKFFVLSLGPDIFTHANACFIYENVHFVFNRPTDHTNRRPKAVISYQMFNLRTPSALELFSIFSILFSSAVHVRLAAMSDFLSSDDLEWLHFLHQISTVRTLYISRQLAFPIATALKSITGEMVAEALPSVDLICLEDQPTSSIEKFIAVRTLSGRPVTAVGTEEEFNRILKSYNRNEEDNR